MRIVENWEDSCVLPKDFESFSDREKWAIAVDLRNICWRCGISNSLHPVKTHDKISMDNGFIFDESIICSTPRPFFCQMTLFDSVCKVKSLSHRSLGNVYWDVDCLIVL